MELQQVLRQVLEHKIEQRQEIKQQLALYIPEDFAEYIDIETDEDIGLLKKSLPFLCLHEFSHPLYSRGRIVIPEPSCRELYHNGIETGIDKAAMLLGPLLGRYTHEEMLLSHYAMMERVFRDHFDLKKYSDNESSPTFIARLYAEIKEHREQTINSVLKSKLEQLLKIADSNISSHSFSDVVKEYSQIYHQTMFVQ